MKKTNLKKNIFNNNGFTMIELIAVTIILAVISLIVTMTISDVIVEAKQNAVKADVLSYINIIDKTKLLLLTGNNKTNLKDKVYQVSELAELGVEPQGVEPDYGWVEIKDGVIVNYSLCMDENIVEYDSVTSKPVIRDKNNTDKILPLVSVNKKVGAGKVTIELNVADNESGINYVTLPNNDIYSLRSTYDSNGKDTSTKILVMELSTMTSYADLSRSIIQSYFSNVTVDQTKTLTQLLASDYDIYISDRAVWASSQASTINSLFSAGKNMFTSGNDNSSYSVFKTTLSKPSTDGSFVITKNITNEVTSVLPATATAPVDGQRIVELVDGSEVWYNYLQASVNYGEFGYYQNALGSRWINFQPNLVSSTVFSPANRDIVYRNSIYRASGKKSLTYDVSINGSYTFQIVDIAGNIKTEVVNVTEL